MAQKTRRTSNTYGLLTAQNLTVLGDLTVLDNFKFGDAAMDTITITDGGDLAFGDNEDFAMRYDSGNTQFEFENNNNNNVYTVQRGGVDIDFKGNVGLGGQSPSTALDVNGTTTIRNQGAGSNPTLASNDANQVLDLTGDLNLASGNKISTNSSGDSDVGFEFTEAGGSTFTIEDTTSSDVMFTMGGNDLIRMQDEGLMFFEARAEVADDTKFSWGNDDDAAAQWNSASSTLELDYDEQSVGTTALDIQRQGSPVIYAADNGNVGINTDTPGAQLVVVGNAEISEDIGFLSDNKAITFGQDDDSRITYDGSDTIFEYDNQNAGTTSLDFKQNTSSVFTLNSSGNATVQNTLNINNSGAGSDPTLSSNNASQVLTLTGDLHASNISLDGGTTTISSSEINLLDGMSSKTGSDTNFVTGTSGTSGNVVEWDGNGDAVDSGTATSSLLQNVVEDTSPQLGGNLDVNGNLIEDTNGNELLDFTATASAVNHFQIVNAATGNGADLQAVGGDTNIDLLLTPKGTGIVSSNANLSLDGGTTEISSSEINLLDGMTSKTGTDTNFVTGTAGSDNELTTWTTSGDLQTETNLTFDGTNLDIAADSSPIRFGAGQDSLVQFNGTDTIFEYDVQNSTTTSLDFQQNSSSVLTLNTSANVTVQNTLNINNSGSGSDPDFSSNSSNQTLDLTGNLSLGDSSTLQLGDNNDANIQFDGLDTIFEYDNQNNATRLLFQQNGTNRMQIRSNGNVSFDNDSQEIIFGAGFDSSIQFDGTDTLFDYDRQGSGTASLDFQNNGTSTWTINTNDNLIGNYNSISLDNGTTTISSGEINLLNDANTVGYSLEFGGENGNDFSETWYPANAKATSTNISTFPQFMHRYGVPYAGTLDNAAVRTDADLSFDNATLKVYVNGASQASATLSSSGSSTETVTGLGVSISQGDEIAFTITGSGSAPRRTLIKAIIE